LLAAADHSLQLLYYKITERKKLMSAVQLPEEFTAGLHNSESSKGQIININLRRAANVYFILMWRFRCSMEGIL